MRPKSKALPFVPYHIVSNITFKLMVNTYSNIKGQAESVVRVGCVHLWRKGILMLHPFLSSRLTLHLHTTKRLSCQVAAQTGSEISLVITLHPETSTILLAPDIHSPVSIIEETRWSSLTTWENSHGCFECLRKWLREVLKGELGVVEGIPGLQGSREAFAVLESAVADQFGVQTTVAGVVDVLMSVSILSPWWYERNR